MGRDPIDLTPRRKSSRPADEEGDVDASVIDGPFQATQARVETGLGRAVVGEKNDDRISGQTVRLEGGEYPAHVGVDVRDHRVNPSDGLGRTQRAGSLRLIELGRLVRRKLHRLVDRQFGRGGLQGIVRAVEGQVGEERAVATRAEEIDGGCGVDVAAISLVLPRLTVVLQDRIEIAAAARRVGRLADTAPLDHQGFLKSLVDRPHGRVVTQMPLAEDAGAITRCGQDLGDGCLIRIHQGTARVSVHDPCAVVIPAGHQAVRVGEHTGETKKDLSRTLSRANRSRFGVRMFGLPSNPRSP